MRMHADRARRARRPLALAADERGSIVAAVLPSLLATMGLTLLAVGVILSLPTLLVLGAGLAVVGCAVFGVALGLEVKARRATDARVRNNRARRKDAERAFASDHGHEPLPRNPLADDAVAALTGQAKGGIWPPLPSGGSSAAAKVVPMWAPGARVATPAFSDGDGGLVEFESAAPMVAPAMTVLASGGAPAPSRGITTAQPDDAPAERDFRVWPGARDLDRWATFTGERRPRASRYSEEELREAMDQRRQSIAGKLPTIGAILADVDGRERDEAELEGLRRQATRGKCSQCSAIIWAPKKRPIVLKCPGCGHKAKLY